MIEVPNGYILEARKVLTIMLQRKEDHSAKLLADRELMSVEEWESFARYPTVKSRSARSVCAYEYRFGRYGKLLDFLGGTSPEDIPAKSTNKVIPCCSCGFETHLAEWLGGYFGYLSLRGLEKVMVQGADGAT
jgi:hypothetical protein